MYLATDTFTVHPFEDFLRVREQLQVDLREAASRVGASLRRFFVDDEQKVLTIELVLTADSWVAAENFKMRLYREVFGIEESGHGSEGLASKASPYTVDSEQLMLV